MKIISLQFLIILLLISHISSSFAENPKGFLVTGIISDDSFNGKQLVLLSEDAKIADSTVVVNRQFLLKGSVDYPVYARLQSGTESIIFLLVNDAIQINLSNFKDQFEVKYQMSHAAERIQSYYNENKKLFYNKYKDLISQEAESKTEEEKIIVQQKQDSLVLYYLNFIKSYYSKQTDRSGLSIIMNDLTRLFGIRENPEKIKELFPLIPSNEQTGYYGKKIQTFLENSNKIALGQMIDFEYTDQNGHKGRISDFKGKLVLLEFWATWCGPCLSQFPIMKEIGQSDKIKIITISIDDSITAWKKSFSKLDDNWVNIHYKQQTDLKKKFHISGVPFNLLLSQDGKIMQKRVIMNDLLNIVGEVK